MRRIIALIICLVTCSVACYSQERKTIDRTHIETVKPKKKVQTSSSVANSTKVKSVPKQVQNRPQRKVAKKSYFSISSQFVSFGAGGGSTIFEVSSSSPWKISVNTASWARLERRGNTLHLCVDYNNSTSSRTDYFTISSGSKSLRVDISQRAGKSLAVSSSSIDATINSVRVSNDADIDGDKGLSVKVSFNVKGMKGHSGRVSCYFYDSSGNALIDTNGKYCTDGSPSQVAMSKNISPRYDNSEYTDLEIEIPYKELHLSGSYSRTLRVDVIVWDYNSGTGKIITRKNGTSFTCVPDISYLKVDWTTQNKYKSFGESGGREYYSVETSASSYETWGVPSWCRIENKTSSGFTLVCERNTSRSSRSDYMKVKAAGKEIRIDIEQDASSGPTASITSVEQVHNVMNGFYKGMNIKLKFDVRGMKGRTVKATAWFYYADNTTKLKNMYGGQVNVSKSDIATYDGTTFTMTLFMPYQGLNMSPGWRGSLSFDVIISDGAGNTLARSDDNSFTYTSNSF